MSSPQIAVRTEGGWLGPVQAAAFGWLSTDSAGLGDSGVLVLPPIGYAWWSSYHTLRLLAERLAGAGHAVLRLQYHGTGNAAGTQWELDQLTAWRASVRHGATQLRELGCRRLAVIGVGLGGSLALEMAAELDSQAAVLWSPVISGRREARALRLRSTAVPDDHGAGSLSFAGTIFGPDTLTGIAAVDLLGVRQVPPRVLVIDGPATEALTEHLTGLGADVERFEAPDGEQALSAPAEDAVAAMAVITRIADWLGQASGRATAGPPSGMRPEIELRWEDATISERVVTVTGLIGLLTSPASVPERPGTVVLLNSGSEPHVGAGRAWVELARHLATRGHRVLRIDFRGWGESPHDGHAPGRPYDAHCLTDTELITAALRTGGEGPVALVGLCAGAWVGLRATLERPADAVVALNPQLYWQPGDPVEALMSDTRVRRTGERRAEEQGRESGRWDALDRAGDRNAAGAWLDQLASSATDVTFLFAEGDDGLEYLHNRLALRLAEVTADGAIHVREIPGIDHGMHRAWLRPQMFEAIADALERTPRRGTDAASGPR